MNLLGRQVQYDLFTWQTHYPQYIDLSARILGWRENNSNLLIQHTKQKLINPVLYYLYTLAEKNLKKKLNFLCCCSQQDVGCAMRKIISIKEMDFLFGCIVTSVTKQCKSQKSKIKIKHTALRRYVTMALQHCITELSQGRQRVMTIKKIEEN